MKISKLSSMILAGALLASGSAGAASIINGSFEDNVLANGTWMIFNSPLNDATHSTALVNGWASSPGTAGIEIRNNVAGQAYDGNNFVELDTDTNSVAYQNIATTLGEVYTLSFAYSPRPGVTGPVDTNNLKVYWNGSSLGLFGGINPSATTNNWVLFTTEVTGTGTDTLRFEAIGTSDSYGGSLDAVSITTAVPEPEVYAMLAAGLGLMGFVARRRKQHSDAVI